MTSPEAPEPDHEYIEEEGMIDCDHCKISFFPDELDENGLCDDCADD
jgi:hypothetical protein